jgi:hypothetical protein
LDVGQRYLTRVENVREFKGRFWPKTVEDINASPVVVWTTAMGFAARLCPVTIAARVQMDINIIERQEMRRR